jgi:hypothetical protein
MTSGSIRWQHTGTKCDARIGEGQGTAAQALASLGIGRQAIRQQVEQATARASSKPGTGPPRTTRSP